jgi:hypothetical protein
MNACTRIYDISNQLGETRPVFDAIMKSRVTFWTDRHRAKTASGDARHSLVHMEKFPGTATNFPSGSPLAPLPRQAAGFTPGFLGKDHGV